MKVRCLLGFHLWSYGLGLSNRVEERSCARCSRVEEPTYDGLHAEWRRVR